MGTDKATLDWRGRPLWDWQLERLRALTSNIFVSARSAVSWLPADAQLVVDEPPSRGPLSGLTASLAMMETDCLLALAVDMPFITVARLKKICNCAKSGLGAAPVINGKAEPLATVYPKSATSIFVKALERTDHSVQRVIRELTTLQLMREIPIGDADARFFRSINYRADLET